MAFLFQDQNQGIRNDAPRGMRLSRPFSFIRTLTVGFGITPNLLTLPQGVRKALAGLGLSTLTAGGDFHPALRTLAARYERPRGIMANGRDASKDLQHGESAYPYDLRARLQAGKLPIKGGVSGARGANSARRTRATRIRFRFVLMAIVNASEELWTSRALPVDGLRVRLRGFRKSHHLIPAGPGPSGDCSWQRRVMSARVGLLRAYQPSYLNFATTRSRRHVPPRRHHRFPEQSARGGRGHRRQSQLVIRTLRRRRGDDRLQGRMDRLPAVLHLDDRNRGAASGLRLRHEDSRPAPCRGAAADRGHQRAIMDRAFRSLDPYWHDHAPAGAGAAGRHRRLDRAMREHAGRRYPRLRALLSGIPVRGLGRQIGAGSHERGDVRHRRRGVRAGLRGRERQRPFPLSCPGIVVRRTASLPLAYVPAMTATGVVPAHAGTHTP